MSQDRSRRLQGPKPSVHSVASVFRTSSVFPFKTTIRPMVKEKRLTSPRRGVYWASRSARPNVGIVVSLFTSEILDDEQQ